ncbi:hypothetical protein ACTFIW_008533 [Dictyostelium discoideum]
MIATKFTKSGFTDWPSKGNPEMTYDQAMDTFENIKWANKIKSIHDYNELVNLSKNDPRVKEEDIIKELISLCIIYKIKIKTFSSDDTQKNRIHVLEESLKDIQLFLQSNSKSYTPKPIEIIAKQTSYQTSSSQYPKKLSSSSSSSLSLSSSLSSSSSSSSSLKTKNLECEIKYQELESKYQELERKYLELEINNEQLERKYKELENQNQEFGIKTQELETIINQSKHENSTKDMEIIDINKKKEELAIANKQMVTIKNELDDIKKRYEELEKVNKESKENYEKSIAGFEKARLEEINLLVIKYNDSEKQLGGEKLNVAILKKKIEKLTTENEKLSKNCDTTTTSSSSPSSSLSSSSSSISTSPSPSPSPLPSPSSSVCIPSFGSVPQQQQLELKLLPLQSNESSSSSSSSSSLSPPLPPPPPPQPLPNFTVYLTDDSLMEKMCELFQKALKDCLVEKLPSDPTEFKKNSLILFIKNIGGARADVDVDTEKIKDLINSYGIVKDSNSKYPIVYTVCVMGKISSNVFSNAICESVLINYISQRGGFNKTSNKSSIQTIQSFIKKD